MPIVTVDILGRVEFGTSVRKHDKAPNEYGGETLTFLPERAAYVLTDANDVLTTQLEGGLPRLRRDLVGSSTVVQATWLLTSAEYETFQGFYQRRVTSLKDAWFFATLLLDNPETETFLCAFLPGTFQLINDSFDAKTISAQLEVVPIPADETYDLSFVDVYGAYLDDSAAFIARLSTFANHDVSIIV